MFEHERDCSKKELTTKKDHGKEKKIFSCANETTRRYGLCSEFSRAKSFGEGYSNEQFCREAFILKSSEKTAENGVVSA